MWTNEKPTGPCACAYERDGKVWNGVCYGTPGDLLFSGICLEHDGKIHKRLAGFVSEMLGRWLILDIPDPPKRMTPGEFVWKRCRQRLPQFFCLYGELSDTSRETLREAVTAAIAAARRGELLVEE